MTTSMTYIPHPVVIFFCWLDWKLYLLGESFFLTETASAPLQLRNLTMVGSVLPSLWHMTIWLSSNLTAISSKRSNRNFLRSFLFILLGMPVIRKQFLLECCSSLCSCLSSLWVFFFFLSFLWLFWCFMRQPLDLITPQFFHQRVKFCCQIQRVFRNFFILLEIIRP